MTPVAWALSDGRVVLCGDLRGTDRNGDHADLDGLWNGIMAVLVVVLAYGAGLG